MLTLTLTLARIQLTGSISNGAKLNGLEVCRRGVQGEDRAGQEGRAVPIHDRGTWREQLLLDM